MAYKSAKFFKEEYDLSFPTVYRVFNEMSKLAEYAPYVKTGILRADVEAFDRYVGERNKYRWRELAR